MNIQSTYDVVIVGARVAGAAVAMLLARAGKRVLAIDRSAYGSDTTSTHALMRGGVMQLNRWGVLDRVVAAGTPPVRKTTFHYGGESIAVPIVERDGIDALIAPRRTVLDAALVDAAREAGAQVEHRVKLDKLMKDDAGRVTGVVLVDRTGASHRVEAATVVGADGERSSVAHAVDAEVVHETHRPCACIYGYVRGLDLDGTHWYWEDGVAAGAIPTNDGNACVFASMPPARFESKREIGLDRLFMDVLTENDVAFARAVAAAERVGKLHPAVPRDGFIRRAYGPGWALVGDAGVFRDPLTAHGITDALRDAELLANAIIAGTVSALADYEATRDAFATEFVDLSDEVASFDWTLEEVRVLHLQLSKLMNRECDLVRCFDREVPVGAGVTDRTTVRYAG